jgi:hypothetical protein
VLDALYLCEHLQDNQINIALVRESLPVVYMQLNRIFDAFGDQYGKDVMIYLHFFKLVLEHLQ